MATNHLGQMRCNNGRCIHNRISKTFRSFSLCLRNPDGRQMKGRFKRRNTRDFFLYISRVHGHIMVKQDFSLRDLDSLDLNDILIRIQLDIIPETDNRHNRTQFQRHLPSNHYHSIQQVSALIHISQRNNTISKFQFNRIHLQQGDHILGLSDFLRLCLLLLHLFFDALFTNALADTFSGCKKGSA